MTPLEAKGQKSHESLSQKLCTVEAHHKNYSLPWQKCLICIVQVSRAVRLRRRKCNSGNHFSLAYKLCFLSYSRQRKVLFKYSILSYWQEQPDSIFIFATKTDMLLIAAVKQLLSGENLNISPPFLYTDISVRILCCRNAVYKLSVWFLKSHSTLDPLITL